MYDRRVFRGSTTAAMAMPSNNYSDQLFVNKKKEQKLKPKQEQQLPKNFLPEMSELQNLFKVARTLIFKLINL